MLRRAAIPLALASLLLLAAGEAQAAPSWVELGAGGDSGYAWTVKVRPSGGRVGRVAGESGPCLLVATKWRSGFLEYHRSRYRQCGPGQPLRTDGPPLLASGVRPGRAGNDVSAVGMLFAPTVRRVRVTLGGGRQRTIPLRRIDSTRARRLGLGKLRYAAFSTPGTWCVERLVSLGAGGRALWDSGMDAYRCGAGGPPHFMPRRP